jgi:hypothetical protein
MIKRRFITRQVFSIALIIIGLNFTLFSYPTGMTGRTLKSGTVGCFCHGNANPSVSVTIGGPATLSPKQTGLYTVTIVSGAADRAGVDIAASNGILGIFDANLQLLNGELTHNSAKIFTNQKYVFNFYYTAPDITGIQTIYASGVSSKTQWNFAPNFSVNVTQATSVTITNQPGSVLLLQNYPNPFNPSAKIKFTIPYKSFVTLKVYDALGCEVRNLISSEKNSGQYEVEFNASNLSSGIYYCRLQADNLVKTNKMLLLK